MRVAPLVLRASFRQVALDSWELMKGRFTQPNGIPG